QTYAPRWSRWSGSLPQTIQRRCRTRDSISSFAANDWLSVIFREHLIEGCHEPRTWSDRTRCARRADKIRPDECDRTRPGHLRALGDVKARANCGTARQRAAGYPLSSGARSDCRILRRKRPEVLAASRTRKARRPAREQPRPAREHRGGTYS